MKTLKSTFLVVLVMFTLGCGYGSKYKGMGVGGTPAITSLTPSSANVGDQLTLVVTGTNLGSVSSVLWGTTAKTPLTPRVAGQVSVSITSADTMTAGTVQIHVHASGTGYGNGGVDSNNLPFTVN